LKRDGGLGRFTVLAIASGLGTGYSPFASGTAGSLLGLLVAYVLSCITGLGGIRYASVIVFLFVIGVYVSGRAEALYGQKDSGKIVIDEIVGMLITLYLMPATPTYFVSGFFLFRFFDVLKPFPARRIDQRMGGGLGVMLDDVAAAIYANLCLWAAKWVVSAAVS